MITLISLGLATNSVRYWKQETEPFLNHVKEVITEVKNPFKRFVKVLAGTWKLFPLVLDLLLTFTLVNAFGIGGSVLGVCIALSMSNTLSYFLNKELARYKVSVEPETPNYSPDVQAFSDRLDAFNSKFFNFLHSLIDRLEALVNPDGAATPA